MFSDEDMRIVEAQAMEDFSSVQRGDFKKINQKLKSLDDDKLISVLELLNLSLVKKESCSKDNIIKMKKR